MLDRYASWEVVVRPAEAPLSFLHWLMSDALVFFSVNFVT